MGVEALGFWDEGLPGGGGVPVPARSGNYQLGTSFQSHVSRILFGDTTVRNNDRLMSENNTMVRNIE